MVRYNLSFFVGLVGIKRVLSVLDAMKWIFSIVFLEFGGRFCEIILKMVKKRLTLLGYSVN